MSVRATNVYEERSLGLFDEEEDDSDEESAFGKADPSENKMVGWTRYLAFHARRQLAFDIWWLGLALWLVCIIERASINNPANESFFNIFAIIFELVSAYGTVGLSLGVSNVSVSFPRSPLFDPLRSSFADPACYDLVGQFLPVWCIPSARQAGRLLRHDPRPA